MAAEAHPPPLTTPSPSDRSASGESPPIRLTTGPRVPIPRRAVLLVPAGLGMLVGLDAGLLLAELPAPVTADRLPEIHGMVMVLGFLGALIALERAIALRRSWAYAAPALLGSGGLALAVPGLPAWLGQLLLLDGAIALTIGYAVLWRRQRDIPTVVQVVAAGLATMAALLWLRVDVERIVPLLLAFLGSYFLLFTAMVSGADDRLRAGRARPVVAAGHRRPDTAGRRPRTGVGCGRDPGRAGVGRASDGSGVVRPRGVARSP